jgi:hypothetical protein
MNAILRKFVPRAPRYILRPNDRKNMRFSLEDTVGPAGIEETILMNLSQTGVAFLTNGAARIEVGERIKVEIPIPSGEQIAWWRDRLACSSPYVSRTCPRRIRAR